MKNIIKAISTSDNDLTLINRYTRRALSAEEIYTFSVILCDNEIDRDSERFTLSALGELKELFIGKTGIFDHNPKGQNQTARVYDTEIFTDESKKTSLDEAYVCLKAKAYMVRSDKNADLILEIDGGIKKEVSVSCSVSSIKCSICGAESKGGCKHQKGKSYSGKKCHWILDNPTDAYEWSFVAVPAQKNAGVTKNAKTYMQNINININNKEKEGQILRDFDTLVKTFGSCEEEIMLSSAEAKALCESIIALEKSAKLGAEYKQDLIKETARLSYLTNDGLNSEVFSSVAQKMDIHELKAFKSAFEKKLGSFEDNIQLKAKASPFADSHNNDFRV